MFGCICRKRRTEDFERLVMLLAEGKDSRNKESDFNDLCSALKISRVIMDNMFYDIVGMSGDEFLRCLRGDRHLIEH